MEKITASRALFIKLGRQGKWEKKCIDDGTMRVSYRIVPHEFCQSGKWDDVIKCYRDNGERPKEATRYANELKNFYKADDSTIWITFYGRKLWWGFCKGSVTADAEGCRLRGVVSGLCSTNGWCSTDVNGQTLDVTKISSRLTKVAGYRGTICEVSERALSPGQNKW